MRGVVGHGEWWGTGSGGARGVVGHGEWWGTGSGGAQGVVARGALGVVNPDHTYWSLISKSSDRGKCLMKSNHSSCEYGYLITGHAWQHHHFLHIYRHIQSSWVAKFGSLFVFLIFSSYTIGSSLMFIQFYTNFTQLWKYTPFGSNAFSPLWATSICCVCRPQSSHSSVPSLTKEMFILLTSFL